MNESERGRAGFWARSPWPILALACALGSPLLLATAYANRARLAAEPGDDTYFLLLLAVPALALVGLALAGMVLALAGPALSPGRRGVARAALAISLFWLAGILAWLVFALATWPAHG